MTSSEPVLITSIYQPKTGSEKNFVKLWTELIASLAYDMGADTVAIYHNEETDEYLASLHWPSERLARKFLHSLEFQEAIKELNTLCFVPAVKEHFEIFHEKAA